NDGVYCTLVCDQRERGKKLEQQMINYFWQSAPQQDQDGLQVNWKIQKSPPLILMTVPPGVSSLPNQVKLLLLHLLEGCGGGNYFSCHGNSEISAPCQLEPTNISFPKEERHDQHQMLPVSFVMVCSSSHLRPAAEHSPLKTRRLF
ncbi:hypothetical protein BaRGS_00010838, partial [Batillaria attramentaria]